MKNRKRRHSLFTKILFPLLVVMVCQSIIFYVATVFGGVSSTLRQNAEDVLTERVATQQNVLETKFTNQWSSLGAAVNAINKVYASVQASAEVPVYSSKDLQKEVLGQASATLISTLRANEVTGAFLILNNAAAYTPYTSGPETKYGLCVRDDTPTAEYSGTADLQVIRGPSAVATRMGCSLAANWEALYAFTDANPGEYFYKPLQLAYENPDADITDLAYFCGSHRYASSDRTIVSYSLPLVDAHGYPYGVLGVELSTDYLKTLISASTLYTDNAGCYALVQYREGSDQYSVITYDGMLFQQCFGAGLSFTAETDENGNLLYPNAPIGTDLRGSRADLTIYNHNTPFESERLALLGLVRSDALYRVDTSIRGMLLTVSLLVLLLGVLTVLFISRRLTLPIIRLSDKVRHMNGNVPPQLDRLQIDEIDDLVDSIEGLSDKISRSAVRTEFFSRMSHDMRTPMNAIIGFSSPEVLEGADLATTREYLEKIHSSGNYLLTLINEVLDMTKIESQRMKLCEEPVTAQGLLDGVVPMISEIAKERQVDFRVQCTNSSVCFLADRQRMQQILMNLLSNAVKFTDAGGSVLFSCSESGCTGTEVSHLICVQDTGCGMSADFQQKMYEPFSQEAPGHGGTGLGLSIARQLVLLMGGTIACESHPGQGTTFTIFLTSKRTKAPMLPAESPSVGPVPASDTPARSLAGHRILLCEDHPLNMQIARRLLERRGLAVVGAENGLEGLQTFRDSPVGSFDLILMDIRMPEMNGLEATRAIRALNRPDAATVPIVAMTANAFKEDVDASRSAGMNEHLSKPIDPSILYVTLEKFLS